ncbi:hypothetical protein C8E97_5363 [Saccharothrix australiensis]|uniref:REase associating with pPIWI RE domain-containing protein n=1 Tax=Saccharothrix australiensis TaxID=2072 RepID=A0A495W5L8_9PSEU|nr:hypothetical protein C8E97_5363 [Saccharothrix australiensis]
MSDQQRLVDQPDVELVASIAAAIVGLDGLVELEGFRLPYPAGAQRALDRLVLRCLQRRARPPTSLMQLVAWCAGERLEDWPLELPRTPVWNTSLLDDRSFTPTQLCLELVSQVPGGGPVGSVGRVLDSVRDTCASLSSRAAYQAFRGVLLGKPVITEAEYFELETDNTLSLVIDSLKDLYEPVPDRYRRRGEYRPCARCRTLLLPLDGGDWWCEQALCEFAGKPQPGPIFDAADVGRLHHLARPLRQFVTGPGRFGVKLAAELSDLGLVVEWWPKFGLADLGVSFPDGRSWLIDVKDWVNPALLAGQAVIAEGHGPADELLWAVPRARFDVDPDYATSCLDHLAPGMWRPSVLPLDAVVSKASLRLEQL